MCKGNACGFKLLCDRVHLPDEIMGANHKAESQFLPRCGSLRFNPFRMCELCADLPERLIPMALRQIEAGNRRFAFMRVGFTATREQVGGSWIG